MKNEVEVTALDKRFKKLEQELRQVAIRILDLLDQKSVRIEVYLAGKARVRKLNRQYRGKDEPTNILAFEFPKTFPRLVSSNRHLGEIYLCPTVIRERGESINLLLAHGLLHLLGFNHKEESDRIQMAEMEDRIRQWLNR